MVDIKDVKEWVFGLFGKCFNIKCEYKYNNCILYYVFIIDIWNVYELCICIKVFYL